MLTLPILLFLLSLSALLRPSAAVNEVLLKIVKLEDSAPDANACTPDHINNENCNLRSALEYCIVNSISLCAMELPQEEVLLLNHSLGELQLGDTSMRIEIEGHGSTVAPLSPNNNTLPVENCLNVTVEMRDIYGDGWQGN